MHWNLKLGSDQMEKKKEKEKGFEGEKSKMRALASERSFLYNECHAFKRNTPMASSVSLVDEFKQCGLGFVPAQPSPAQPSPLILAHGLSHVRDITHSKRSFFSLVVVQALVSPCKNRELAIFETKENKREGIRVRVRISLR